MQLETDYKKRQVQKLEQKITISSNRAIVAAKSNIPKVVHNLSATFVISSIPTLKIILKERVTFLLYLDRIKKNEKSGHIYEKHKNMLKFTGA